MIKISLVAIIAFVTGLYVSPTLLKFEQSPGADLSIRESDKLEYYTCPMHAHIHEASEGDCPICGMTLVKKENDKLVSEQPVNKHNPEIFIQSSVINNFAIKTAKVTRSSISKNIRIYGYISQVKNQDQFYLKSPVSGIVKSINNSNKESKFYKNEVIIELESNEILELQKKYLESVKVNDVNAVRILNQKLSMLGVDYEQLKQLISTEKPTNIFKIRSPDTGLITIINVDLKKDIKAGSVIGEFKPLYSISAYAKVYESQWLWLKDGQKVSMKVRNLPGVSWDGEVRSVDDLGQSSTTAVKLVADFEGNEKARIRLGMRTEMIVYAESKRNVLQVPASSVIRTGSKTVVVVAKGQGLFQPVDVETGLDNDDYIEIISGLEEDMNVVVSGQFLLDSESELSAELSRMSFPVELSEGSGAGH
ncbi:MAG: efflux RND transporter periplasmic adaptor subunit [Gammaproteobacteria bacterium]|nr:efflux RND transporter periplasmic adaptor subunit [Gammaproteobacteria bacterium]